VAVAALRSALAAIGNAEAVTPPPAGSPAEATHAQLAGTVVGVGEVDERRTAADAYERAGRPEVARRLRAEADVLGGYLARRP
jgi:uncharacterized protein